MKQKKRFNNSPKRITNSLFNYVPFKQIYLNPIKLLFYNDQDLPYTEHLFLRIYWDRENKKTKEGKYDELKRN